MRQNEGERQKLLGKKRIRFAVNTVQEPAHPFDKNESKVVEPDCSLTGYWTMQKFVLTLCKKLRHYPSFQGALALPEYNKYGTSIIHLVNILRERVTDKYTNSQWIQTATRTRDDQDITKPTSWCSLGLGDCSELHLLQWDRSFLKHKEWRRHY